MSNDTILTLVLSVALAALFGLVTHGCTADQWRNEAAKQGHAEYYLDENHQRQWRWLPNQTRKE